jgi:hypothetical protein
MKSVSVPEHVMVRQLGEDCVILDTATGTYFGLDAIGSRIWRLLSETGSTNGIGELLAREYDVTANQAAADLDHLVDELIANGLLNVE